MPNNQTSDEQQLKRQICFVVVFYSDQRESPSSDFSLSCDGKSVAHRSSGTRHKCCQSACRTLLNVVERKTFKATQRWSLPCSSCFLVWPFAELLDEPCVHAVQCVARGKCQKESEAYCSSGQGQMKADIAGVVSLLTQQPRALQDHVRLLVTMQKKILGHRPAIGTRCTILNNQTSDEQQLKRQICSLWYSILIKSLPLVTLV